MTAKGACDARESSPDLFSRKGTQEFCAFLLTWTYIEVGNPDE